MTTLAQAARCRLTDEQLAAALALAGIAPGPESPLTRTAPPADPAGALQAAGILDGGHVAPAWRDALAVLSAPDHVVSIAAVIAGSPTLVNSVVACGSGEGPFVAHPGDGRHDLALLPTVLDAVLYADRLLEITAGTSGAGEPPVTLGLPGIAALAALADALQRARVQALLDRTLEHRETWTAGDLERLLADGASHEDTRWATTAIRHAAPVELPRDAAAVGGGLAELERAGLVGRDQDRWTLTAAGRGRVNAFSQLVNVGTITRAALDATGAPSAACASVLRTVTGVWLLTWNIGDDDTVAVLEEVTAGQALELVWSMFRPAVA